MHTSPGSQRRHTPEAAGRNDDLLEVLRKRRLHWVPEHKVLVGNLQRLIPSRECLVLADHLGLLARLEHCLRFTR